MMVRIKTFDQLSFRVRVAILTLLLEAQVGLAWLMSPAQLHGLSGLMLLGITMVVAIIYTFAFEDFSGCTWHDGVKATLEMWIGVIAFAATFVGVAAMHRFVLVAAPGVLLLAWRVADDLTKRQRSRRERIVC